MANKFDLWLEMARPGSDFIYHTGGALSKGGEGIDFSDLVYSAREAYEAGRVDLVQRRISWGRGAHNVGSRFAWIAIKRATTKKPQPWVTKDGEIATWRNRPVKLKKAA